MSAAIARADAYLDARTGCYEWRCVRYDAALEAMHAAGLDDSCTVFDVGAGMGEFGVRMHTGTSVPYEDLPHRKPLPWVRSRYVPVDAAIDGTDLNSWRPPRDAEFFVALELLEHLTKPATLVVEMKLRATRGIIVSTPNPDTTDVLGMDPTHRTPITRAMLEAWGFEVEARSFYGGEDDSLFGVWRP